MNTRIPASATQIPDIISSEMNGHWPACFLALMTLSFCIGIPTASEIEPGEILDEDELAVQRWRESFIKVKQYVGAAFKLVMPFFMSGMSDKDLQVSQQCRRALFQWVADIKSTKPWALESKNLSIICVENSKISFFKI